jgi:hypothetical protein
MSDYSIAPEYLIIKYIWSKIVEVDVLDANDYYVELMGTNIMPFLPLQQQPETNLEFADKTFFVYESYSMPTEAAFWLRNGELTLFCYDNDFNKIVEVRNFLLDYLGRKQSSAADVNDFSNTQSVTFKTIDVPATSIDKAAFDDDGRQAGEFVISFEYVINSSLPAV